MKLIEDIGMQYYGEYRKRKFRLGIYECDCGNIVKVIMTKVKQGKQKSCGCLRGENHGMSDTNLYYVWQSMKDRSFNINNRYYMYYGGRGISICKNWSSFVGFYTWSINNGYMENLSIDRIDNDGNYEPSNCRWVNRTIQSRNTRKIRSSNTSGFRGVTSYDRIDGKSYVAAIAVNKRRIHIGTFESAKEAALAYDGFIQENNLEHTRNF